jgi:hypothetical protein
VVISRTAAPIMSSIRMLLLSMIGWEIVHALRSFGPDHVGSWPINPLDLVMLLVMPGLTLFAFTRLFMAVSQAGSGSLNTYTLTSSPWAWTFWLGIAITMVGQGTHIAASALNDAVPQVVRLGDYGIMAEFWDGQLGHWLLGSGFFLVTLAVMVLGQGAAQRIIGGERAVLMLGSLLTYGVTVLYIGVQSQHMVPAILGSAVITGIGLWILPPYEMSRDPVSLLVIPGTAAAGLVLFAWGLLVGGQPTWPG